MPYSRTMFHGGGSSTEAQGSDVPNYNPAYRPFMNRDEEQGYLDLERGALLRRQAQGYRPPITPYYNPNPPPRSGTQQPSGGGYDMNPLQAEQLREMQYKDQLARQGPPMSYKTIYGQTFLDLDPNKMNAYQRQMYLPQSASFPRPKGDDGGGGGGGGGGRSSTSYGDDIPDYGAGAGAGRDPDANKGRQTADWGSLDSYGR